MKKLIITLLIPPKQNSEILIIYHVTNNKLLKLNNLSRLKKSLNQACKITNKFLLEDKKMRYPRI